MTGSVLQINISSGGVPKHAIETGVVTELGIEGDAHAHPEIHGGMGMALLIISSEGIQELADGGYSLYPGALGENVTTQGLDRREWRLGQRWRIGDSVLIEFTKMRAPCSSLTPYGAGIQTAVYDELVKADDPASPRWGLGGAYAKVLHTGTIRAGDVIRLL